MRTVDYKTTSAYASGVFSQVDVERLMRERYGVTSYLMDGDELRCSCPLPLGMHSHGDRNPSFSVNIESRLANCYVCGGGNMSWFIRHMEPRNAQGEFISEQEALGIAREYMGEFDAEKALESAYNRHAAHASSWGASGNHRVAQTSLSPTERWAKNHTDYWGARGLKPETVEVWGLGYATADDPDEGFRDRAIIPHVFGGSLVGWSGRVTEEGDTRAKWRHSEHMPKDTTLFNYDRASLYSQAVVVEAPLSAIWLWQANIPNAVATFGASVTLNQERLLRRFDEVILWMDADIAGWKSMLQLCESLRGHSTVWVVNSWKGDPMEISKGQIRSAEECFDVLYGRGLLPGFMFDIALKGNIDRSTYHAINKVRKS